MADKAPGPTAPQKLKEESMNTLDIFERYKLQAGLKNRIMRALKDAADDEMRKAILAEVSSLNALINGAK